MSDLVGISSGAVQAYQRALGVVSNNIANVGTEGYTRQVSDLAATAPRRIGQAFLGTGVEFQAIRRSVDEFIQQNMRNSNSDLAAQSPLVDYAARVVDIMGSEESGLTSAMNAFFNSARELSIDASSPILRASFLQAAKGIAGRFSGLAYELDAIAQEGTEYLRSTTSELNSLSKQLAEINGRLSKQNDLDRQPATLLDQRDLILQKMSALAKVKVSAYASGQVAVSVGSTFSRGVIVDKLSHSDLSVAVDPTDPSKFQAVVDPYGENEAIAELASGEIGGLLAFRQQVLGPAISDLDFLASAFAANVNAIHQSGMDSKGDIGAELFDAGSSQIGAARQLRVAIDDPERVAAASLFSVLSSPGNSGGARLAWEFVEPELVRATPPNFYQTFVDSDTPTQTVSVAPGQALASIASINAGAEEVVVSLQSVSAGQALHVITRDGKHLLGAQLSNQEQAVLLSQKPIWLNDAVSYDSQVLSQGSTAEFLGADLFLGAKAKPLSIENFTSEGKSAGFQYQAANLQGGAVEAGLTGDIIEAGAFSLNGYPLGALNVPVGDTLEAADIATWLNAAARNTIASDVGSVTVLATAIDLDKNFELSGAGAYPIGIDFPEEQTKFADLAELVATINQHSSLTKVQAAEILTADGDQALQLSAVGGYEEAQISLVANPSGVDGLVATAVNQNVFLKSSLDLTKDLTLQSASGTAATFVGTADQTLSELISAINGQATVTGVSATTDLFGDLVLTNVAGFEGEDILVGPADDLVSGIPNNALTIPAGSLKAQVHVTRPATAQLSPHESMPDIRLGIETAGSPYQLTQLGFAASAYVSGASPTDLVVFLSGEGSAQVSAQGAMGDYSARDRLRANPIEVRFTAMDTYQVWNTNTSELVSTRSHDPHQIPGSIEVGGMTLRFSSPPAAGDQFFIDGNQDGVGDNGAVLKIVELEDVPVLPNGRTLTQGYISQVSDIGNTLNQAKISQEALQVVYEQAIEANQAAAGVSLDQEAADLIRFQQAYQASAKVMQTASTLFDSILQVR